MNTLGLESFGVTLALGTFTLVMGFAVIVLCVTRRPLDYVRDFATNHALWSVLVGSTFAVVLGLLAEDLSDAVEDHDRCPAWLFANEKVACADAVLESDDGWYVNTPFAKELASARVISMHAGESGAALEAAINACPVKSRLTIKPDDTQGAFRKCYFNLKNIVYREDNYFTELRDYASRIRFARAAVFSCLTITLLLLASTTWVVITRRADLGRRLRHGGWMLGSILLLGLSARVVLQHEETERSKRVFGYGLTLTIGQHGFSSSSPSANGGLAREIGGSSLVAR